MNMTALLLLIWLFVALDRYVEFENECIDGFLASDRKLKVHIIFFALFWAVVMSVRIGLYMRHLVRA